MLCVVAVKSCSTPSEPRVTTLEDWSARPNGAVFVQRDFDGHFVYATTGETGCNVAMLHSGTTALESELTTGRWLVLGIAKSSGRADNRVLENAIFDICKLVGDKCKVAIRPIESAGDVCGWLPSTCDSLSDAVMMISPIWILLEDGELIGTHLGWMSPKDVRSFVVDVKMLRGDG